MPTLKGTQTEKNLLTAFAGESQARNRYTYAAKVAAKEGFIQMSHLFERTADQERVHAKTLFKLLEGGEVEITAAFPAGTLGSTLENLESAAAGEEHEYKEMYPSFAEIAEAEGFPLIAATFRAIARAEEQHAKLYRSLIRNIKENQVFQRENKTAWQCSKCGYVHEGLEAPSKCPACTHPQSYFELLAENW